MVPEIWSASVDSLYPLGRFIPLVQMKDTQEAVHGTRTGAFFHFIKHRSHFSATVKISAVFNPARGALLVLPFESEAARTIRSYRAVPSSSTGRSLPFAQFGGTTEDTLLYFFFQSCCTFPTERGADAAVSVDRALMRTLYLKSTVFYVL